jgi:hypothetical protein
MNDAPPPRLFVLVAAASPHALVLRRGPSAWVHLIAWDTRRDAFTEGAWYRGRIYEEKCDLSPDGALFLYSAHQGRRLRTSYTDSWTAVSRPPWLHALALWPMGTTYGGGGRFVGKREITLRGVSQSHPKHPPLGLTIVPGRAQLHRSTGEVPDADWCGHDYEGRLVFTRNGRVFRRSRSKDVELADFNGQAPDPQAAPEWAKRPL